MSTTKENTGGNAIIYSYPNGDFDILCASDLWFQAPGWEAAFGEEKPPRAAPAAREKGKKSEGDDRLRSARRARAKLRRLALSNGFTHFVTLTLDREKVDRYDPKAIMAKVNRTLDNLVRRQGLAYILVPELHQDGAYHFHGFIRGRIELVDSGTIRRPGDPKPRRPHSAQERAEWLKAGGHVVYNWPAWGLGFSTALSLYGDYAAAVAYVCKYIGKQDGERPMGRWYYSGGGLAEPPKEYALLDFREIGQRFQDDAVEFDLPGSKMVVIHHRNRLPDMEE